MQIVLGAFLYNAICAIVSCPPVYQPPHPVPIPIPHVVPQFHEVINSSPSGSFSRSVPPQHYAPPYHRPKQRSHVHRPRETPPTSPPPGTLSSSVKIPILKSPFVVSTQSGKVEGFPMKTIRSRNIIAFTSIPYAEKPIGQLCYADPVPKKPWTGVLKATKLPSDCLQIDGMQLLRIVGSLDCLYLNVYTPAIPLADEMSKMKVIIFIHGGSFAFGSGSMYGPAYLLEENVVLVTFNYRLSSQGFLSTGDDAAPGNFGLKDQRLVLKWVQSNIASFGGDANNVILIGQSAGAVSVHLHMMSKQSQGLFRAGISQSGNAFCFWGVRQNSVDFTYQLANSVRCPVNDSYALVDCMRKLDPLLIAYHEAMLPGYKVFPGVFFGPLVEPDGPNAFLTERPEKLYEKNLVSKVPWINGFLVGEGNGVSFLTWLYPFVMQEVDSRWSELGPKILDITGETQYTSQTAAHIKNFYFGSNPINFYTRDRLSQMVGDRLIVSAVYKGLRYHSKIAPTYGYFFNFTGRYGTASIYGLRNKDWGVSHDDDLLYLFNTTRYEALKVGEPEYQFSQFLVNVWSNFASFGEPFYITDKRTKFSFWNPVNISSQRDVQVVLLSGDVPKMINIPYRNRIQLWEELDLISNSEVKQLPAPDSSNEENMKRLQKPTSNNEPQFQNYVSTYDGSTKMEKNSNT